MLDLAPDAAAASGQQRWAELPDAMAVADAAAKKWGATVFGVHGVATDWDDIQRAIAECHERLGGLLKYYERQAA